jgi:hypothetical protein
MNVNKNRKNIKDVKNKTNLRKEELEEYNKRHTCIIINSLDHI